MSADRISKAQRWIDLIACLLGRRTPMTVDEIFEAVPAYRRKAGPEGAPDPASVRRMFERDKDELRDLGVPIDTVRFSIHFGAEQVDGYELRPGAFYLPYLRIVEAAASRDVAPPASSDDRATFTRAELEVALAALREAAEIPQAPFAEEARSAYRKLAFDLDSVREGSAVRHVAPPGGDAIGTAVRELSDALRRRKRVAFRYHGIARGETTERDVAPYGLFLDDGTWYLVGQDALRDALRMFHVGRMEDVRANSSAPGTPDYEIPDGFSLGDYVDRESWQLGDAEQAVTARVRFPHPLSLWADRNGYGTLEGDWEDGGVCRTFEVSHARPFLLWLLGLQGEARLLEPAALVHELGLMAAAIASDHE